MPKKLIIVESPNKVKSISKYVGDQYLVKPTVGHMFDLPQKELGVDVTQGFKPKYVLMADKQDKLKAILDAAAGVDEIIIASDPDREGEAIAWHVAQALQKTKKPIQRIKFGEISKKAIQHALKNPRQIDENLFHAQEARRVLDRLAGYLVSPYVIRHFGPHLSAGRVQSVVVRLIVDREREIENFKPEEYWSLIAHLIKDDKDFFAKIVEKIDNTDKANIIKSDLLQSSFIISHVAREQKEKRPPPPFITSELLGTASAKLKFNNAKTSQLAQKLFEAGYITYPRPDSHRIEETAQELCRQYLRENGYTVPAKPHFFKDKEGSQQAHEAIRPTDIYRTAEELNVPADEKKLYTLIRNQFLMSQMSSAIYDTVTITIKSSVGNHVLKANGRILSFKGWLELGEDEEKSKDVKLPIINEQEIWQLGSKKVNAEQKFTKPPPRFNGQSLIKELESLNIGRPSTFAAITSKVQDRNYVTEKNNIYYPTDLGKQVTDDLVKYFDFLKYDYTAEIEHKLDQIADGKYDYLSMMRDFYPLLAQQLQGAAKDKKIDYGFKCHKCDAMMELKQGKFGYFLSCINYPECKSTLECTLDQNQKPVLTTKAQKLADGVQCQRCGVGMIKRDGKFGPFYGCSTWPKCTAIQQIPYYKCSQCGGDMTAKIINEELKLSCMNYPTCKHIMPIPKNLKIDWVSSDKINKGNLHKKTQKIISRSKKSQVW